MEDRLDEMEERQNLMEEQTIKLIEHQEEVDQKFDLNMKMLAKLNAEFEADDLHRIDEKSILVNKIEDQGISVVSDDVESDDAEVFDKMPLRTSQQPKLIEDDEVVDEIKVFEEMPKPRSVAELNDQMAGVLSDEDNNIEDNGTRDDTLQGEKEFLTEIELLSRLHHRNLVSLVGYCFEEEEQMLVYEYMPNSTLRDHLSGKSNDSLSFAMRLRIAMGRQGAFSTFIARPILPFSTVISRQPIYYWTHDLLPG